MPSAPSSSAPAASAATRSPFDRRFVSAALMIGIAYSAIVVALGVWVSKDAAGIAGVALTALAVAIFKQFETLQFRAATSEEISLVVVPANSLSRIALLTTSFVGGQYLLGYAAATLSAAVGWLPPGAEPLESWMALIRSPVFMVCMAVCLIATYFLIGLAAGRTTAHVPGLIYTYVAASALLALLLGVLPLAWAAIQQRSLAPLKGGPDPAMAVWLAYVSAAVYGARIGILRQRVTGASMP